MKNKIFNAWRLTRENKKNWSKYRDEETGADLYLKQLKNKTIIYIDHTNEKKDWVTNIAFMSPYSKKHFGYEIAAINLYRKIENDLYGRIEIVSYSMGSGISPLLAEIIRIVHKNVLCVAFAGPRYVCKSHIKLSGKGLEIIHVDHKSDIVPKLPPFGFSKYGTIIKVGKKKFPVKFRIDKRYKGIRKYFDLPYHHRGEYEKAIIKYFE